MTREETKQLIRTIMEYYPNFKTQDVGRTIDLWHVVIKEQDYKLIGLALKQYIITDRGGFAPTIGQLIGIAHDIASPAQLNGQEAWSMAHNAIRNSTYHSLTEFAKLPELVQQAVGSPDNLRQMAMSEDFNLDVARSNFLRTYDVVCKRRAELEKMPKDVGQLVQKVNNDSEAQRFRLGIKTTLSNQKVIGIIAEKQELSAKEQELIETLRKQLNE